MAILLSALRFNAILSFGKRAESHGAKFAALVGRGNRFCYSARGSCAKQGRRGAVFRQQPNACSVVSLRHKETAFAYIIRPCYFCSRWRLE